MVLKISNFQNIKSFDLLLYTLSSQVTVLFAATITLGRYLIAPEQTKMFSLCETTVTEHYRVLTFSLTFIFIAPLILVWKSTQNGNILPNPFLNHIPHSSTYFAHHNHVLFTSSKTI